MPEPVEIRRRRNTLRIDDSGVSIRRLWRTRHYPWESIVAVGWGVTIGAGDGLDFLMAFVATGGALFGAERCLHFCVKDDPYSKGTFAVPHVGGPSSHEEQIRSVLGEWLDRIPKIAPPDEDTDVWWPRQPESRPNRVEAPREPSLEQRKVQIRRELDEINRPPHS